MCASRGAKNGVPNVLRLQGVDPQRVEVALDALTTIAELVEPGAFSAEDIADVALGFATRVAILLCCARHL